MDARRLQRGGCVCRSLHDSSLFPHFSLSISPLFAVSQEDVDLPIKLLAGGHVPGFLINLRDVSFGYPGGPMLFSNAEIGITAASRVVLLGENGNGKTTLVRRSQVKQCFASELLLLLWLFLAAWNSVH